MKMKELKFDFVPRLNPGAVEKLMAYDWPGNIRELQNIVERAIIRNTDGLIQPEKLLNLQAVEEEEEEKLSLRGENNENLVGTLKEVNSRLIKQAMTAAHGKINGPGGAAELLGIGPNTLRKRMDKLGIPYKRSQAYSN
jgi:hydrogenase-4 transcriptional activator